MRQGFSLDNSNGNPASGQGNRLADELYRDWPERTAEDPTESEMQSPLRGGNARDGQADWGNHADLGEFDRADGRSPTPQEPDAISRAKYWLADVWAQHRNVLLVVLGLAVGIAAFAGWNSLNSSSGDESADTIGSLIPFAEPVVTAAPPKPVVVHITGAVISPDVYHLTSADRMIDLVEAAGGFLETADKGALNLAQILVDETYVCVPEVEAEETAICRTQPIQVQGSNAATALIDPNTASAIELERLNGIGPAMSARIVEWREQNGEFRTAEDLLAIPGIGPATLDRFRSQLSLQ